MAHGRCRMHGAPNTGPRTAEGLERSRKSGWKHGHYSAEAKQVRRDRVSPGIAVFGPSRISAVAAERQARGELPKGKIASIVRVR